MSAVINPAPKELVVLLEGLTSVPLPKSISVHGLAIHSAEIRARDLFLALRGRWFDGADFLHEAVERGAVAAVFEATTRQGIRSAEVDIPLVPIADLSHKAGVIASRFFEHPSAAMQVTAVTGTDGKSSVSHLLAEALQLRYGACGLIGTIGCGQFGSLGPGTLTTPDALRLQLELHRLRSRGNGHAVIEASSHGLDQGRLVGVDTRIGVFTNLARDHLDYHDSVESYAEAKEKLFEPGIIEHAIINVDESFGRKLAGKCARYCKVTTYALDTEADVVASGIACQINGLRFNVDVRGQQFSVKSRLTGRFNVSNLIAVFSALLAQGVPPEEAAALLGRLSPVRGRMQLVSGHDRFAIIDYAHTPHALEALLRACREIIPGKLICVFGCGGERDRGKRPLMGKIVSRLADVVVITDDNPRNEDPARIVDEIQRGITANVAVTVMHDRERAISHAVSIAGKDDCVVVAGKGHEEFQVIDDKRLRFDDADVVRRLLVEVSA